MADADYAEQTKPSLKHGNGAGHACFFAFLCSKPKNGHYSVHTHLVI